MSIEVKVPQLPESVADATLVAWHKSPGDRVSRDENLADLETDKVVLEVPAPADGVLKEIRIKDGTTVTAGEILAILEEGGAAAADTKKPAEAAAASAAAPAKAEAPAEEDEDEEDEGGEPGKAAGRLSPAVRRLVDEHDLDPAAIRGSGRDGRITKADVMDFLEKKPAKPAAAPSKPAAEKPAAAKPAAAGGAREERRVPMTRMRARIAERLVDAQATAAMLTSFNEVDLGAVMEIRNRYKESFEKKHGVRIGFMSFFVKAAIEALRKFPVVNASIEDNDVVYHDYFDIGVAVSTDRGLMVPVLRDADSMSFADR
jgi:2-oxoglutarate dehydrogenase E2 component (dihydrolipoamide succinyltransferase)